MKKIKKTAETRTSELWNTFFKDLPPKAIEFVRYYSMEYGACGEVCLTAFSAYAQMVEKLPCENPTYRVAPRDREALLKIIAEPPKKVATQTRDASNITSLEKIKE